MTRPPILAGFDAYAVDTVIDPYPFHEAMRNLAPVVTLEPYDVYAVGRYEGVLQILNDWQNFSSASGVGIQDIRKPGKFRIPSRLVEVDPPDHTEVRRATTRILSPRVVRTWRGMLEERAREFVSRAIDMGEFDAVQDFAEPYILEVFAAAVGVDLPRENVVTVGDLRFNQPGPENQLYREALERATPYLDWYERCTDRSLVVPGSIADQFYEAEDRGEVKEGVGRSLVRTLIGGGTDSTIAGLGACMHHLARNPDQMRIAADNPSIMRIALDEGIRMESPFQVNYRTVNRDMDFAGYRLEKDRKLGLWIGAGNRDPRKWENPDKFDLTRETVGVHVAFGAGIHVCIGMMLARLEAECLLVEFAGRVKSMEPTGRSIPRPMNQMRALKSIPVRIVPK